MRSLSAIVRCEHPQIRIVQLRHGCLRVLIGGHLDEGKAARATRLAVPHDVHRFDGTGFGKERLQVHGGGKELLGAHACHRSVLVDLFAGD